MEDHPLTSIIGTSGDDFLTGTRFADTIAGRGGNDRVLGLAGRDRLFGDAGNDSVHGGDGADRIAGGSGNDRLFGDSGDDLVSGNAGRDYLWGGAGDDRLAGGPGDDVLRGNVGDDILRGGDGRDLMEGGAGDDLIFDGPGVDSFIGGSGYDTVSFVDADRGVFVHLADEIAADRDPDDGPATVEPLQGIERVFGSRHDDVLFGEKDPELSALDRPVALFGRAGDDWVEGGSANDTVNGGEGNDLVNGNDGNDRVTGGAGDDLVRGGRGIGDDRLTGGSGEDVFSHTSYRSMFGFTEAGVDTITDFHRGEDLLRWGVAVDEDPGNGGAGIPGLPFIDGAALFAALDTDGSGILDALDRFTEERTGGASGLVIDFSAFIDTQLDDAHSLNGLTPTDTLTLLGVTALTLQDIEPTPPTG